MDTFFKIPPVFLENFPWIESAGRAIENGISAAEVMRKEMDGKMPPGHKRLPHTRCRIEKVKDYCQCMRFRTMRSTAFPQEHGLPMFTIGPTSELSSRPRHYCGVHKKTFMFFCEQKFKFKVLVRGNP